MLIGFEPPEELVELDLSSNPITDDGLKWLPEATALRILRLHHTSIGDLTLKVVGGMSNITDIAIGQTHVTTAGLRELVSIPHLDSLDLGGLRLDKEAMSAVSSIQGLTTLIMTDAGIDENQLVMLTNLVRLRNLHLETTAVSSNAIQELRRVLPRCWLYQ